MGDIYHAGNTYAGSLPIDDTKVSDTSTWSSQKINSLLPFNTGLLDIVAASTTQNVVCARAEADMITQHVYIQDPSKVTGNLTVTPYNGGLKVDGTVTGATKINVSLQKERIFE